jgi:hypothetical protein
MKFEQGLIIRFLDNEVAEAHDIHTGLLAQFCDVA